MTKTETINKEGFWKLFFKFAGEHPVLTFFIFVGIAICISSIGDIFHGY